MRHNRSLRTGLQAGRERWIKVAGTAYMAMACRIVMKHVSYLDKTRQAGLHRALSHMPCTAVCTTVIFLAIATIETKPLER